MTVKIAHCFFEQSGTFKRVFESLGIAAKDYDIQNEFGETDVVIDIFSQIKNAYAGRRSIFDSISRDDIIIAFYPCIFFCEASSMIFMGVSMTQKNMTAQERLVNIIKREKNRYEYYSTLLKLFWVCERKQLRLVVENPYNAHHYLRFNFPYKPAVIDMNRRLRGDYVRKPTQYFFLNCTPAGKTSIQLDKIQEYTRNRKSAANSGTCSAERSMISEDYARNFICDHILGIETKHTQPTLF